MVGSVRDGSGVHKNVFGRRERDERSQLPLECIQGVAKGKLSSENLSVPSEPVRARTVGLEQWRIRAEAFAHRAIWLVVFPGFAIILSALSLQMVGDGLRDLLDPKLRRTL